MNSFFYKYFIHFTTVQYTYIRSDWLYLINNIDSSYLLQPELSFENPFMFLQSKYINGRKGEIRNYKE